MTPFITIHGNQVPVIPAPGLDERLFGLALESPKFLDWAAALDPRLIVSQVVIQSVDEFPKGKVGFLKIDASITKDGKFVPGIGFIRGDSVAVLVVLDCEGKLYCPLTLQPRPNVGPADFAETAAGMLDSSSFLGAAAKEMAEELHFTIPASELVDLRQAATGEIGSVVLSPGGCDEEMRFYLYRRSVTPQELAEIDGRLTGLIADGEIITLKVVPIDDVWSVKDGKTLIAIGLYDRAMRRGAI